METIVLGGGCFWCTEAIYRMVKGVSKVTSGYAGGKTKNPTYGEVSTGRTGHAEVVKIEFNPKIIRLERLLGIFFASHDPTQPNRQGNDIGTQYRSAVFFTNETQRKGVDKFISEKQLELDGKIVTEVKPLLEFYPAEEVHESFFEKNPYSPYCTLIIRPKMEKVRREFGIGK